MVISEIQSLYRDDNDPRLLSAPHVYWIGNVIKRIYTKEQWHPRREQWDLKKIEFLFFKPPICLIHPPKCLPITATITRQLWDDAKQWDLKKIESRLDRPSRPARVGIYLGGLGVPA